MINALAVFCGSKTGATPLFMQHAQQLGWLLAQHNIELIYGGGNKGLMGCVANAVLEKQGKVTGIIPQLLKEWEHAHDGLTTLHVVADMHIRKKMMYELCDAAVILPGGYGTLDEMFEMITWNNLKIHNKKIVLLNSAGFYDALLSHAHKMFIEDFLYEDWRERIIICDSPEAILSFLV